MSEKIYTIPINEVFDECAANHALGCPFCRLYNRLESGEVDTILGASMMEPDTRMMTNEKGFCAIHAERLIGAKNRLGYGLMMESHLDTLRREVTDRGIAALVGLVGNAAPKRIGKLSESCYICDRIDGVFDRMLENAALLYSEDSGFAEKIKSQPYICLPHFGMWLSVAGKVLKKGYSDFYRLVSEPVFTYFDALREDVSWFCKKFDYRYDDEPWGNAKDAPERANKFLCGDLHKPLIPGQS